MNEENDNFEQSKADYIIECFIDFVEKNKALPTVSLMLTQYDITRDQIRAHFGNFTSLVDEVMNNHAGKIDENIAFQTNLFLDADSIRNSLTSKIYVITTAVSSAKAHEGFLKSLDKFCDRYGAQVCIMPAESITNSFENQKGVFDPIFNDEKYIMIGDNYSLNENLHLASIQVSAKQIKPITGLARIGSREGSYIFASPKQFLEIVPSNHTKEKTIAIMTPGACTKPDYFSNVFVSKRLSYIAEHDHQLGAIIVEIENDKIFHFRHIQAMEDGSFVDLGLEFTPKENEIVEYVETHAVIELHTGYHSNEVLDSLENLSKNVAGFNSLFIHDGFDGHSINHHITNIGEKASRFEKGKSSLKAELEAYIHVLTNLSSIADRVYCVKSNHDEFLDRYLSEGRYVYDPENHKHALEIASGIFDEMDTMKYALLKTGEHGAFDRIDAQDTIENIIFLSRDDSLKIGGVEMAAHGDLGLNGGKSSLNGLEKVYGKCVVGHVHTPAIQRGVFRIGVVTDLDMGYNRGPSGWMNTIALVYNNGSVQLLNWMNGKFTTLFGDDDE